MADVTVEETAVPGVLKIDLALHLDDRGWFKESYQRAKLEAAGFPQFEIAQANVSHNMDVGVTRGIHAEPWDKYISLAAGEAFAAVVDLRAGPTFGTVVTCGLHVGNALFVPRGCGNSYQTLTAGVAYSYLVNAHWSAAATYTYVDAFDPTLGIGWPIDREAAIRSAKDLASGGIADVVPIVEA